MIGTLMRSRGVRKFRRNRLAMGAIVVIAIYLLFALWVATINTLNDVGNGLLEDRPLIGMVLRSRLAERVGPNHMAGFGIRQSPEKHSLHLDFYMLQAQAAIDEIGRLTGESDLTVQDIMDMNAVGERTLADLPVDELQVRVAGAREAYDEMVVALSRAGYLVTLEREIDELVQVRKQIARALKGGGLSTEQADLLKEELSLSLEDIVGAIEDYQSETEGDDPLAQLDADAIFDVANEIYDAEELTLDVYDHEALITALSGPIEVVRRRIKQETGERIDAIEAQVATFYPHPDGVRGLVYGFKTLLGTDRQGRSILIRALYSSKIAVQVGFIVGLISVIFGSLLGAAAAFYGKFVDSAVNWLFSVFTSIPSLVLLVVLAFAFTDSPVDGTLIPLYVAFCVTYWIGPCRVVRGETMKIKELEYVQAATAIGFGRFYILLKHIIPNTIHLMFINFSLLFIGAIKGEVILTYLGLGVKQGTSWGIMIRQSIPEVPNGNFWQIGGATFFMFVLVLAFNIVSDALQDAFDPKHQG